MRFDCGLWAVTASLTAGILASPALAGSELDERPFSEVVAYWIAAESEDGGMVAEMPDLPPEVAAARFVPYPPKDFAGVPAGRQAYAEAVYDKCADSWRIVGPRNKSFDCNCLAVGEASLPEEEAGSKFKIFEVNGTPDYTGVDVHDFSQCYMLNNVYRGELFGNYRHLKTLGYPVNWAICTTDLMTEALVPQVEAGNKRTANYSWWKKTFNDASSTCSDHDRDGTLDAFVASYSEKRKAWLAPSLEAASSR